MKQTRVDLDKVKKIVGSVIFVIIILIWIATSMFMAFAGNELGVGDQGTIMANFISFCLLVFYLKAGVGFLF